MTAFPSYSTGTVSVSNGGTTVTGVSTIWSGVNARPGDLLQIGSFGVFISDVTDTTHLVVPPYPGTTVSGSAYKIYQTSPLRFAGGQAMVDVSALVAALNDLGFIVFVTPGSGTPDPSIGEDGQYATDQSTGQWWKKIAGVWTSTTSPSAGYGGTSATSLAIGTGSKVFTTQANLAYNGARVRAASAAAPANFMSGICTYSGTTLTMTADATGGSGTKTDWVFSIDGSGQTDVAATTHAATGKTTPINADEIPIVDSAASNVLKKLTWANLKTTLFSTNLSDIASPIAAIDNLSVKGSNIASASTINLDTATGNLVHVTGTTTITAVTLTSGRQRTVIFDGALTLTNGASLVLPGAANIPTAAGDVAVFVADGTTIRCSDYQRANSAPVDGGAWTTYTPSLAASSGTFTTATAAGAFKIIGKTAHLRVKIVITTVGTAGGTVNFGLPSGVTPVADQVAVGRETAVNGKMITATLATSATTGGIANYDNSSVITAGAALVLNSVFEMT